jgi:hypothetical protein
MVISCKARRQEEGLWTRVHDATEASTVLCLGYYWTACPKSISNEKNWKERAPDFDSRNASYSYAQIDTILICKVNKRGLNRSNGFLWQLNQTFSCILHHRSYRFYATMNEWIILESVDDGSPKR